MAEQELNQKTVDLIKRRDTFDKRYNQMTEKQLLYENLFTNQEILTNMKKNTGNTFSLLLFLVIIPAIIGLIYGLIYAYS